MPRSHPLFGRRDFTARVDANPVIFKVRRPRTLSRSKKAKGKKTQKLLRIPTRFCCDSVSAVMQALDLLGFQNNWITLTQAGGRLVLAYQGWLPWLPPKAPLLLPFKASDPEPEKRLAELLERLFKPFELQGSMRYRSRYEVTRDMETADRDMDISLLVILNAALFCAPDMLEALTNTLTELDNIPMHVQASAFEPG